MRCAAIALVACAACSGLEPLTGTCGDGVVDPGEDCDSGPGCRACSIDCSTDACPTGYACGVDKLCHAPGGRFAPEGGSQPFPVLGFGVTETDGDGYNDVVGLSNTSLDILHGDAAATLARTSSFLVPQVTGAPAVTRIDGDDRLDMVIPTPDGLIAYTSRYDVISPYPFPIELDLDPTRPRPIATFELERQYLALLVTAGGSLGIAIIDGSEKNPNMAMGAVTPVCAGIDPGSIDLKLVDTYQVAGAPPSHVIALATTAGALCSIEVRSSGPTTYATTSYKPATAAVAGARPVLARLGVPTTPCPSIVVMTGVGTVTELLGSNVVGSCATSGTRALPYFGAPVGRAPLSPAVANVGPDALAYQGGVFAIAVATGQPTPLFMPNRPIAAVASLDVDGDGDIDAVTSASGVDDLQVLYRFGTGNAADPAGYLAVAIDTVGVPTHLLTGDFDGDGIGDITYVEALDKGERLMIAFGSRDQVHAPTVVSTYDSVMSTAVIGLTNTADRTGKVDDLIVLDQPPNTSNAMLLTILYGSPQRILMPFFDPRPANDTGAFTSAVSGDFGSTPGGYQDLLAVESAPASSLLWRISPTSLGAMQPDAPAANSVINGGCTSGFCTMFARFVAWRARPDVGPDLVFGIDDTDAHHMLVLDPQHLGTPGGTPISFDGVLEPGLGISQTSVADTDGDGIQEVIVGFGPKQGVPVQAGHVLRCTFDTAIHCTQLDVEELAGWTCIDAVPAHVTELQRYDNPTPRASTDLAVLCRRGDIAELFHVFHDGTAFHATPMLALPRTAEQVQLADITGDGVEDVLVFDRPGSIAVLRVFRQCTSREIGVCTPPEPVP